MKKPSNVISPSEAAKLAVEEIQDIQAGAHTGLLTGLPDLDELLFPLRSNICLLHGITGHGKSTLGDIIMANNLPPVDGDEIAVKVLLEDTIEEQVIREASADTMLSVADITSGKMTKEQEREFVRATMKMATKPVWRIGNSRLDHRRGTTADADMIFDAISWITETQGKRVRLVMIDYFQRIATPRGDVRIGYKNQLDKIDSMAQGFGCPVLLLSQSSREANKAKRVPMEYDMSETKSLEDYARTVMVVYRPHLHFGINSTWDFMGQSILMKHENYILIGIQKQKHKPYPRYRIFVTNEQRQMHKADLRSL